MSFNLPFPETEEAQALLQDVLAFLDTCEDYSTSVVSPTSVQTNVNINGDRAKKRRPRGSSPDYDRCRREKKKAEREALRTQVAQYETQVELLRMQRQIKRDESKWGWVHAATDEEEKRCKAEELNHQLRGLLVQQFNVAQTFKNLINQEAGFAQRVQSVLSGFPPCASPPPLNTYPGLNSITAHLRGMFDQLRDSTDYVFGSTSVFSDDANSLGSLVCSANLKYQDPISGPCIELLSSTPLTCNKKIAASILWEMMLGKEIVGPNSGCYTMKTKELTQNSAQMGYSVSFNVPNASGVVDGVTLMEKFGRR